MKVIYCTSHHVTLCTINWWCIQVQIFFCRSWLGLLNQMFFWTKHVLYLCAWYVLLFSYADCTNNEKMKWVFTVLFYFITARGSIVFSIVAKFFCFSVNAITRELLHLAWCNVAWTCTLTTSRSVLNIKVIGQRSSHILCVWVRSRLVTLQRRLFFVCLDSRNVAHCRHGPRAVLSLEQGLTILFSFVLV